MVVIHTLSLTKKESLAFLRKKHKRRSLKRRKTGKPISIRSKKKRLTNTFFLSRRMLHNGKSESLDQESQYFSALHTSVIISEFRLPESIRLTSQRGVKRAENQDSELSEKGKKT